MSLTNKEISRRFFVEAWGQGKLDVIDDYVAADYVHNPIRPNFVSGPEGMKQRVSRWRAAFPDFQVTVDDQIAEGDRVVTRWSGTGTQQAEIWGIPPSGKRIEWQCMTINRLANGKVVESWALTNALDLMEQLEAISYKWE